MCLIALACIICVVLVLRTCAGILRLKASGGVLSRAATVALLLVQPTQHEQSASFTNARLRVHPLHHA